MFALPFIPASLQLANSIFTLGGFLVLGLLGISLARLPKSDYGWISKETNEFDRRATFASFVFSALFLFFGVGAILIVVPGLIGGMIYIIWKMNSNRLPTG